MTPLLLLLTLAQQSAPAAKCQHADGTVYDCTETVLATPVPAPPAPTFDPQAVFAFGQYSDTPGRKFTGGLGYANLVQKSGVYLYMGVDASRSSRVGTLVHLRSFGPIHVYALIAGSLNQNATATLGGLSTAGLAEYRLKGSWAPIAAWQWDSHVQGSSVYVGIVKHWGTK